MPQLILLKQSTVTAIPPTLQPGEPAVFLQSGAVDLYIGDADGTPTRFGYGQFVQKGGDTMSGPLSIAGADPVRLTFFGDTASGAATIEAYDNLLTAGSVGRIRHAPNTSWEFELSGTVAARLLPAGTTAPDDRTLIDRGRGDARYLRQSGGTVSGALTLTAPGTAPESAATRQHVTDSLAPYSTSAQVANDYVAKAGATMTGALTLPNASPTADNHATRKKYVDDGLTLKINEATADIRYAAKIHGHPESQISDLNRLRWMGNWVAQGYAKNDVVKYDGVTYVAADATASGDTPPAGNWRALGAAGANVSIGDSAPSSPLAGDLWFRTTGTIGLYVWFVDVDSSQWVSTDQAAALATGFVKKAGDTMTGFLTLHADPSAALHAASKQYVDSKVTEASGVAAGGAAGQVLVKSSAVDFDTEWRDIRLKGVQQNGSTAITLSVSDANQLIETTAATAVTITLPGEGTAAIPVGSAIHIAQEGDGAVSFVGEAGTTVKQNAAQTATTSGKHAVVSAIKTNLDIWRLIGDFAAA